MARIFSEACIAVSLHFWTSFTIHQWSRQLKKKKKAGEKSKNVQMWAGKQNDKWAWAICSMQRYGYVHDFAARAFCSNPHEKHAYINNTERVVRTLLSSVSLPVNNSLLMSKHVHILMQYMHGVFPCQCSVKEFVRNSVFTKLIWSKAL